MSKKTIEGKIIGHEIESFQNSLTRYMAMEYELMQAIESIVNYIPETEVERLIYETEMFYGYRKYSSLLKWWETYKYLRNVGVPYEHIVQLPISTWNNLRKQKIKITNSNYLELIRLYNKKDNPLKRRRNQ